MSRRLEEVAWRSTPIGELSLRRRLEPSLGVDVYEVRGSANTIYIAR